MVIYWDLTTIYKWWFDGDLPLWLWLTSSWYRWPIEIDGWPINSMVIFHGQLLVIKRCKSTRNIQKWGIEKGTCWCLKMGRKSAASSHRATGGFQIDVRSHHLGFSMVKNHHGKSHQKSCSCTLSWFPNPDHLSFFIWIYLEPYIYIYMCIYICMYVCM